jgi:TolA-binding protein
MESNREAVQLRIHHLMCVHGFKGKGYSPTFVSNFWKVIDRLGNDKATVELVAGTEDEICKPCPNNLGTTCTEETRIQKLDQAYAKTLSVKSGDTMTWTAAKTRIAEKVSDDAFESNCEPCAWKRLGYCKEALAKLRATAAKGALSLLAILAILGETQPARAVDPMPSTSIDVLEQQILLDKARRIPALSKVLLALNRKDYKAALDNSKPLETNIEFADYYHYLCGLAESGRMKKFVELHQFANAGLSGEQAVYHFTQVQGTSPFSALSRKAIAEQGDVEVRLGDIQIQLHKRLKATPYFEKGFQKLTQMNLLVVVPKHAIVSYALLCEKNPTDICTGWVSKLVSYVVKSDDAKLLERIAALKQRPVIEKAAGSPTSTTSYRVDLDLQAFTKGYNAYLDAKYEEAFAIWSRLLKDFPRTGLKLRTKFWMARAAQKTQHDAHAETLFREIIRELPFSYYALLSSWYGNIDLARMMDAELPSATPETSMLSPGDIAHVRRAETLIASGVPELALIELQDVRPSASMPNEFLVYLAALNNMAENHLATFQIFSELSSRGFQGLFSGYGQKLLFPSSRLPFVSGIAKEHRVDPLLVLSVIKQESAFNEVAMSSANAFGLMQIIPPTARDLDPRVEIADLFTPNRNVWLGSKYLNQLITKYRGNIPFALAAYNAGPGNSDRWLREIAKLTSNKQPLALEENIEQIGFRETREYVQSILRNYYWYNRRLRGEAAPNLVSLIQAVSAKR